ncbi:MAG: hemolysin III family protein [Anaerolineae bacterium]|nr:hemolysin III family protein [Anaerolineae bacterium]
MLSKLREPVNGLTHFFTAIAAIIGLIVLLIIGWGDAGRVVSLLVYGISLILLFFASGFYHMVQGQPEVIARLRKFDHAAIYLLIAGTYTPMCWNMFSGFWKWGLLGIIWGLALVGIGVKIFFINAPRWLTAGVYILMGWLAIVGIKEILAALPAGAIIWLLIGGVIYTLGALVYITKTFDFIPGKFGFHEIWHIFVILGALSHYIMIAFYIAPTT